MSPPKWETDPVSCELCVHFPGMWQTCHVPKTHYTTTLQWASSCEEFKAKENQMTDEKELTIKATRIRELAEQCPEWKKGLETLFPEAFEKEKELPVPEITDGNANPVRSSIKIYDSLKYNPDYNFRGWVGTVNGMFINLCPTSHKHLDCHRFNGWPVIIINKDHARDLANTILEILWEGR